ncbi:MAG: F0F1 ATP synthase subunit A [Elusimicrobia bacterium]|nr:F0F1 ATP synthase subunit A [Candidatus Liberimonas magnetica]
MAIFPEAVEYHIPGIPSIALMLIVTWAIIIISALVIRMNLRPVPRGINTAFELLFNYIYGMADSAIGEKAKNFYPLFLGIFLFVLTGNLLGLIPGFSSPTANLSITLGLAIITFLFYQFQGIKEHGFGYIRHFLGPKLPWYLIPINIMILIIEIISHFARIISLSLRLFINIFSKELLLGILASLFLTFLVGPGFFSKLLSGAVFILRPFILLLGVLVSIVQAFVFTILAIVYVAMAVNESH